MEKADFEITADKLFHLHPDTFDFESTAAVEPLRDFIGQERAIEALNYGLNIRARGNNIFAVGIPGSGQDSVIRRFVKQVVENRKNEFALNDYCCVYNFDNPKKPVILVLGKGRGKIFKQQLEGIFTDVSEKVAAFFGSEAYERKIAEIEEKGRSARIEAHRMLLKAEKLGLIMQPAKKGIMIKCTPVSIVNPGQPMPQDEFRALPDEERKKLELKMDSFMNKDFYGAYKKEIRKIEENCKKKVKSMEKEQIALILRNIFRDFKYPPDEKIRNFIKSLINFVLKRYNLLKPQEQNNIMLVMAHDENGKENLQLPFQVNLLVDNSATAGAPVIVETNPVFSNLVGKIDRKVIQGFSFTDHTMIQAGSIAEANGGFLILYASELLLSPYGWHTWIKLKNTLKTGLTIEDFSEYAGFYNAGGLKPETIPVDVKVILIGDPQLYHLLTEYDEDFPKLFKIKAEFEPEIKAGENQLKSYAGFIALCCQKEGLLPFDKNGVAKVIEYGVKLVDDQRKISAQFGKIKELLIEADYYARKSGGTAVTGEHVRNAIHAKRKRINLYEDNILEHIKDGSIIINTDGGKVGQANGLAVLTLGDLSFGFPICIVARTFCGTAGLVNIKREVKEMSGPIFAQADKIIFGYLGGQYAQNMPLALSIVLSFEQSYSMVEGDSASIAELLAIISSLSGLDIDQGIAVTGSMRLTGLEQPVGGIADKVEGWFKTCKTKGLTGNQGVMVPRLNLNNLPLDDEVKEAIRNNQFHVYAVSNIDEAIFLSFGREPEEVHRLAQEKIEDFCRKVKNPVKR